MPNPSSTVSDILEILNLLKWPAVVLLIVLIFKKELKSIFSKSKKVSFKTGGMEFESVQDQNVTVHEQNAQQIHQPSLLENATKLFRVETIALFQGYVQKETLYEQLHSDKEKFETLLHYAIITYIIRQFDLIYDMIFGSQIALIQLIISKGAQDMEIFEYYYNQAKAKKPEAFENFELERYPKFLFSYDLLFIDKDQKVQVTVLGIDFIKYLIDSRKNLYKEF